MTRLNAVTEIKAVMSTAVDDAERELCAIE